MSGTEVAVLKARTYFLPFLFSAFKLEEIGADR